MSQQESTSKDVAEATAITVEGTPTENLPNPAPETNKPELVKAAAATKSSRAAMHHQGAGMLIGAGLTLGITFGSKVIRILLRPRKKEKKPCDELASEQPTPESKSKEATVDFVAFGSPNPVDQPAPGTPTTFQKSRSMAPVQIQLDVTAAKPEDQGDAAKAKLALPPGQLKQQLELLRQAQEENARLREFMNEHMAASAKVQQLEQENAVLKNLKGKLEQELDDVRSKAMVSNGEELQRFKLALRPAFESRSVCSDIDVMSVKDNMSVDGSASVIDAGQRTKVSGGLQQLLKWAGAMGMPSTGLPPKSPRAVHQSSSSAQLRSPRAQNEGSVVDLLDAFSGGMRY